MDHTPIYPQTNRSSHKLEGFRKLHRSGRIPKDTLKLHEALERRLADMEGDGFLSLDEFDNADQDTTAIADEYCVPIINDEEDNTGTMPYLRSY